MSEPIGIAADTIERLRSVSTDTIAGLLIKLAGMRTRVVQNVRPLDPLNCRFVGPAFTIRNVPVREDMTDRASMVSPASPLHGTFDSIPAGSVVMIDMLRDETCGGLGDIIAARMKRLGVAGLVADGGMRDGAAIAALNLPVFSAGVAPAPSNRALLAAGVQEIIGCGGVMVVPADIIVADADGVVVIPRHLADEVANIGADLEGAEAWVRERVEGGESLAGLYPIGEATMAEYRRSLARKPG